MFLILFGILWGILLCLLLCAPSGYHILFTAIFLTSIFIFLISRKFFNINKKNILICISSFIASYILCSYFIFKPSLKEFINFSNVAEDKKAVIFYCEGEMEKYTPYYSNYFINKKPFFLKPIYAYKIKNIF